MADNPFVPRLAIVREILDLTPDVKLFKTEFSNLVEGENFIYKPGQFAFVSAFGIGEAPFGITSLCQPGEFVEFAIRKVGTVTAALHELEEGETVGIRGPFGNHFPLEQYKTKNILIIGGGIGMAPLRPVINTIVDNRDFYGELTIIYGARTPDDIAFKHELESWSNTSGTRLELTVDRGDDNWNGRVALVPAVVAEVKPSSDNCIAIICGPPIMIRFTLVELTKLGFSNSQIVTTLESKMKCGLGKCARCNIGDKYVCKNGPVFTMEQISSFLEQY